MNVKMKMQKKGRIYQNTELGLAILKLIDENSRLENLKKQKKDIENMIMEMNKENQYNSQFLNQNC